MKVLISKGVTEPQGKSVDVDWQGFKDLLRSMNHPVSDESDSEKRRATWFSTVPYKGDYRLRENIAGKPWAIVADLDEVRDPDGVKKALRKYEYLAYTTWSSTPDKQRWRVILPIRGGVEPSRFASLVDKTLSSINGEAKIDPRSRLVEQLWFGPRYKKSQRASHRIWENRGEWVDPSVAGREVIRVDFTGVINVRRPEGIGPGDRNNSLVKYLSSGEALLCETRRELEEMALEWNERLKDPLPTREARGVARKTWNWMQRAGGLAKRAEAWKVAHAGLEVAQVGVSLMDSSIANAEMPQSLVGDFLYPGATILSAKMKEGKSYLAMQLAISAATGEPFLLGKDHKGFPVHRTVKAIVLALEDTRAGINFRFFGNIASGHLPRIKGDQVSLVFDDDLKKERDKFPAKIDGTVIFEALVDQWYKRGFRLICIDPLRVLEGTLNMTYPMIQTKNIHTFDFQVLRYFTSLAQKYEDLCIVVSLHHGKNKAGQDRGDMMDAIAGTTGLGAGAVTMLALMPIESSLEADDEDEDDDGRTSKRRALNFLGRYTFAESLLIEQNKKTGLWSAIGKVKDQAVTNTRESYFRAIIDLGGDTKPVTGEEIRRATGERVRLDGIHKVLRRAMAQGVVVFNRRLYSKKGPGGGYLLRRVGSGKGTWLLNKGAK